MSTDFDPYYKWLGIPPEEQPPHHYRLLAIKTFEADPDVIEAAADQRMSHLRTYQTGKNSALSQRLLNEVAAAKVCLLRPDKKTAYDAQLRELLSRQSSGEDTSSQLQALRALNEVLGDDLARPVSQRKKQASGGSPWLAVSIGGAVLVAGIVAWSLFGRGGLKVAEKAEGPAKAESGAPPTQTQLKTDGMEPVVPSPAPPVGPQVLGAKTVEKAAPPVDPPSTENKKTSPPMTMHADAKPLAESPSKAEGGSSAGQMQPKPEEKPKPSPASVATAGSPGSVAPSSKSPGATAGSPGSAAGTPQSPIPNPQSLAVTAAKRPLPPVADQEKSKKEAQDLFRDDYAKAKKPAERSELARRILKKGLESRDPAAEHFALLSLARDVAVSADDDRLACEAIDEIAKSFEVDALAMKVDALATISKSARATVTLHKTLCERALSLGQEALDQDKHDLADTLAKLAFGEAARIRDKDLVQRSRALAKDQQGAAQAYSAVQDAFKILHDRPDDPAANLAVGKYLCYTKGDWSKGLLHLGKSDDAKLKPLAEEERRITPPEWEPAPGVMPPDPAPAAAALKLADSWWDAGQAASGKQRDFILRHAGYWYHQSFGSDTTPLAATKINARLEHIDKIRRQYPAPALAIAPFDAREARLHQRRWADYLDVPWVMTNSIGMKFVLIPPGEFDMGSHAEYVARATKWGKDDKPQIPWFFERIASEMPQHRVRITMPFFLSMCEVTQREFLYLMGSNPSGFSANGTEKSHVLGMDTQSHPVENVTWEDSKTFCERLSTVPGERGRRHVYRLPCEAEWEYACRAGTTTPWYSGGDENTVDEAAFLSGPSKGRTHPVGQKRPNGWGLHDTLGNAWEWCADLFAQDYYSRSPFADPRGPSKSALHVCRGGSWQELAFYCTATFRNSGGLKFTKPSFGFRAVLERL